MSLTVKLQYQPGEYAKGLQYLTRKSVTPRMYGPVFRIVLWLVVAAAIAFVLLGVRGRSKPAAPPPPPAGTVGAPAVESSSTPLLILLAIPAVVYLVVYTRMRSGFRRVLDQDDAINRPSTITFDDEGVSTADVFTTSRTVWAGFVKFDETAEFFYLYTSTVGALIVPKRALDVAAQDELRRLSTEKIQKPTHAFPVIPAT